MFNKHGLVVRSSIQVNKVIKVEALFKSNFYQFNIVNKTSNYHTKVY